MNLQLDDPIYRWLFSLNILNAQIRRLKNSKIEIPLSQTTALEIGHLILKLLQAVNSAKSLNFKLPPANALKNFSTPQDRIFNWNLLSDVMKTMGYNLDPEMKRLIVSGNTSKLNDLLKELNDFFNGETIESKKSNPDVTAIINMSVSKSLITNESLIKNPSLINTKETIDITTIDITKPLDKTDSLLELMIVSLSKTLNLKASQTIVLFTKNTKYLAHVISKGVKGDFDPILAFLNSIIDNMPTLLQHLDNDETKQYLTSFLQTIKPALVSKNQEVSRLALKLYQTLCQNLAGKQLLNPAWDWFINNNGLYTTILGVKRHPELIQETVDFLKEIGKNHILELFTVSLKNIIDDEKQYLFEITQLLEPMVNSLGKEELKASGILDKWVDKALENSENSTFFDQKILALSFLVEVWLLFPETFESEEAKAMNLINSFKKACKDSKMTAFSCISSLFRLLESFAKVKDPFAPIVYKILTFILIENSHIIEIRGLIMNNMIQILSDLESIPLSIIIEPWIKQIQVSSNNPEFVNGYIWNVIDFEFMKFLANQEKLSIKNGIQILDLLSKTFLNDHIYSPAAIDIMLTLISRFLKNETMQEFLSKLIKISLAIYFATEKKRKTKKNKDKIKVSKPNPSSDELIDSDLNIIAGQKNALIVKFLKTVAEMKDESLNEKLKPLVAHTNLQLKKQLNMKTNDKGMIDILGLWGNPDKLSAKYESEYYENLAKEKLKKREEELKSQMKSGFDTTGNISQISATSVREIVDHKLNIVMSSSFEQKSPENTVMTNENQKFNKGGDVANAGDNFESGLRSQGIGYKNYLEKSTLTKSEQTKMALLRHPKADPKILNQLKDLAQTTKDKNQSMILENEHQKTFIEKQKVTLRKQLEKRAIEQGIAYKNLKDIETNLIFPLDSREMELSKEKKHGLFEMELLYMPREEERDCRFVESFFRTNQKLLKYLFVKYCNLSVRKTRPETFEKITVVIQRMTYIELWKLLKDFNYTQFTSQLQVESMVRMINVQIFKEKDENLKSLDFEGFQIFLVNLCYLVYSKDPPEDLRHLPPNFPLERMLKHFREEEKNKGVSTILFDDPEATIVTDSEVLKEFNRKLEEDPDYVLPEGYKKIPDIRVTFEYKLADALNDVLPEEYKDCYSIMNDIVNESLGFCLFEPFSIVNQIYLARPKILNPVSAKVFNYLENKNNVSMISNSTPDLKLGGSPLNRTFTVQPRKKVLEIAHKQPLSFNMKMEIARFGPKYKYMAEEIGYLLEDVLSSVEKGLSSIPKYQGVGNKLAENKTREQSLEEEIKVKKEQKRKMRHHLVKQQMKEKGLLAETVEQRKELMKKRYDDTKKIGEEETVKKKKSEEWDKRMKKYEEEKKKIEEEKKKKTEEEVKKNSEANQQKEIEKKEKKKKFKEFNVKTKEKLKNKFDEMTKQRKESQEKKAKEPEVTKEKIKAFNEKVLPKILEKTADQLKKDKEFNDLLKQKLSSEEFQQYFQKQESTFKALFTYLINNTPTTLDIVGRDTIPLKTFLGFSNDFEICPLLVNFNEIITSYNSMIKGKPLQEGKPIGINYQEFIEIIFRVAAKSHHIMNKISEYMKVSGSLNEAEKQKINQGNENEEKKIEQVEEVNLNAETDHVTQNTLNGLLFYLGLPLDPQKKEEVINCFNKKKDKKEVKTNKKKKLDLQKKLEGEGYDDSPLLTMKAKKEKKEMKEIEKNNKEINKMQEEAVAQIEENQEQEKLQE